MTDEQGNGGAEWVRAALDRHEGSLVRYAQRLTGDVESARDVVQDVFLRLLRQDRAEIEDHLVEWLFTVCRNRALDVVRKERRMTTFADEQAEQRVAAPVDEAIGAEQLETMRSLTALFERLPERQQEVLRLKFQNGLSYKEISRVTALSVSNVGFLIHTGLKTIRELVQPGAAANPSTAR